MVCQVCGVSNHTALECDMPMGQQPESSHEEASYVRGNYRAPRNDAYSPTYTPAWRDHPNFRWRHTEQERAPPREERPPRRPSNFEMLEQFGEAIKGMLKRMEMIENQMAQIASNTPRPNSQLPGQPEENPKKMAMVRKSKKGEKEEKPRKRAESVEPKDEVREMYFPPLTDGDRVAMRFRTMLKDLHPRKQFEEVVRENPLYHDFLALCLQGDAQVKDFELFMVMNDGSNPKIKAMNERGEYLMSKRASSSSSNDSDSSWDGKILRKGSFPSDNESDSSSDFGVLKETPHLDQGASDSSFFSDDNDFDCSGIDKLHIEKEPKKNKGKGLYSEWMEPTPAKVWRPKEKQRFRTRGYLPVWR